MTISNVIPIKETITAEITVPHYVSGRKLTSEDLQHEREAALKHLHFIGRAAGTGIIEGLWVEKSAINGQITISQGLGVNAAGHPIHLTGQVTLDLLKSQQKSADQTNTTAFGPCNSDLTVNTTLLKDGPYLLTAVPVYHLSTELTAVQKILPRKTVDDCTNKWEEESISFRVLFLGNSQTPTGFKENTAVDLRRNLLAHWAFGTEQILSLVRDPFKQWNDLDYSEFGVARNKLSTTGELTDCDLRLAVFYLQTNGNTQSIQFVDNWAVRRRPYQPSQFPVMPKTSTRAGVAGWGQRLNDQLATEGQARFAQFQEHLDHERQKRAGQSWAAKQHFRYLPSAGYVPLLASPMLCKMLSQYMINFLFDEIKKSSANPLNSLFLLSTLTISSVVALPGSSSHVIDTQMDGFISQVNTAFANILNIANTLALTEGQTPRTIEPIAYLKPLNDPSKEVDTNKHVMLATYNGRIWSGINDRITLLTNLISPMGTNYNITITTSQLIKLPLTNVHTDVTNFNNICVNPLNVALSRLITGISGIVMKRWSALNANFEQMKTELIAQLQNNLTTALTPNTNGVAVESFFAEAENISYIKYLAFTDRQAIESILEDSWRAPAIDLITDQNMSLIMVYEDVIPSVAQQLKDLIATGSFTNQATLKKVWQPDVSTTFSNIIANNNGDNRPPLYGLFTQAVYPLQTAVWQQGVVVIDDPSDIDNPSPVELPLPDNNEDGEDDEGVLV